MTRKVLVIGVGSHDHGEHIVGLLVAQRVRQDCGKRADVVAFDGTPDLTERWSAADDVVLVEAVPGPHPGRVHRYTTRHADSPPDLPAPAHHLSPAIRDTQRRAVPPDRLTIYAIEAEHFRREAGVSPTVLRAAKRVAERIVDEVSATAGAPMHAQAV